MSQPTSPHPPKKLLDQYRDALRLKQYSPRTEKTYVTWVNTMIYTHVLNRGGLAVRSPLD